MKSKIPKIKQIEPNKLNQLNQRSESHCTLDWKMLIHACPASSVNRWSFWGPKADRVNASVHFTEIYGKKD